MVREFIDWLIWYLMFLVDEENFFVLINVLYNKKVNVFVVCSFFWNLLEVYRLYFKKKILNIMKKNIL